MTNLKSIEKDIKAIKERNARVEADKAWTYIAASPT